jgi:hypothetical protein
VGLRTFCSEVAQCPCQVSVSRSANGDLAATIRSNHHSASSSDRARISAAYRLRAALSSFGRAGSGPKAGGGVAGTPGSAAGPRIAATVAS